MDTYITICRVIDDGFQSLGFGAVITGKTIAFDFKTLEPPDKQNRNNISCIPAGTYSIQKVVSPTYGNCLQIMNVPGRDKILMHWGNYYHNTEGCIITGDSFGDINGDGLLDVKNSKPTCKSIYDIMPSFSRIIISDITKLT